MLKFLVGRDPTDFFKKEGFLLMQRTFYQLDKLILNIQKQPKYLNLKIRRN
jgi:hypothetical protein